MPNEEEEAPKAELKERFFKCICLQWFFAVIAHTMCLQSEMILIRNSVGGDLSKAARLSSIGGALAGVFGLLLNQIGGQMSDSLGRKPFYVFGPIMQIATGLIIYAIPRNPVVLTTFKAIKVMATTFSGTVIGNAGMRDVFQGTELAMRSAKAGSVLGIAIMVGPFLESKILQFAGPGKEFAPYLGLAALGSISALNPVPETLPAENRKALDLATTIKGANPFGFLSLFTRGSAPVKKLATIFSLQTMIDGKNISDLTQIWLREHLKVQMETIRNFVMGYGFASAIAGAKLVPYLVKNLSVSGFTTFTNTTNLLGFLMRGSVESVWVFFGALPLMLPGVNAASTSAIAPVLNDHMTACGFGVGESTAWVNNLRVMVGAAATLLYGYFYSWCRKKNISAGATFALAGLVGAALPQMLLMLTVKESELEQQKKKAT